MSFLNLNLNLKEAKKNLYIYDLVYKPSQTNLLKEAEINHLNYQNGLAMLVHQAAESFRIWHGDLLCQQIPRVYLAAILKFLKIWPYLLLP